MYAQRFSKDGAAQGPEFHVNSYTSFDQSHPSVAMDADGDFVVVWSGWGQDGSGSDVYARRYDRSGVAQEDAEFRVNSYTTGGQYCPSVATDANGDFVVTWHSSGQDHDGDGVFAQRYGSDGGAQGNEFQVNTYYTTGHQELSSVAVDADGDFVVVWQSPSHNESDFFEVDARRYRSEGNPAGGEFPVSTHTGVDEPQPSVAMDADGDFVVVWCGVRPGGTYEVYARRYGSDDTSLDTSESQVNTYTSEKQAMPSVAMDAEGDFVVAWQSEYQDGSEYGVYAQRYGLPRLSLDKTVSNRTPRPGEHITYTLVAASRVNTANAAVISDTLPGGLTLSGPVIVDPPGAGTPGATPPHLVDGLTIAAGGYATISVPVAVGGGVSGGMLLTNAAAITSSEVSAPVTDSVAITVQMSGIYLPLVLKG